jgi:hypothetical protein
MATIDNKKMIDEIIANNGYYEGDPRIYMIVEYTNVYGNITWGVTWENEPAQYRERYLQETQYVNNPRVIWKQGVKYDI